MNPRDAQTLTPEQAEAAIYVDHERHAGVHRSRMSRRIAAAWLVLFALAAGYVLGFRHGNGYWQDDALPCETPVLQLAQRPSTLNLR